MGRWGDRENTNKESDTLKERTEAPEYTGLCGLLPRLRTRPQKGEGGYRMVLRRGMCAGAGESNL